jgi:iron complex transport system permease protein
MLRRRHAWGLAGLALLAAAVFCLTLLTGSAGIKPLRALETLFGGGDDFSRLIIWNVRLPRATAAFAVGALLGLCGVLLQALYRNPLADPLVLGVSGGAAVGALAGMLAGAGFLALHWYATAGGAAVSAVVLLLGRGGGATRLLLCGVVFASACGALITVMLTLADYGQLRGMVFWLAGDLSWAQRPLLELSAAVIALAAAALGGRWLNVVAAGEVRSAAVGLHNNGARVVIYIASAGLAALAVLGGGMIGFVGLVAPHLVRLGFGTSDHRLVAPGAALAGGALLGLADLVSRTLAAPRELPVGAVMALVGAPVFIVLLRRQTR